MLYRSAAFDMPCCRDGHAAFAAAPCLRAIAIICHADMRDITIRARSISATAALFRYAAAITLDAAMMPYARVLFFR